ncbi:MAG: 2-dehydropantoate 2-reductase, partial [Rhodospirillales bacterium]|nr:2-dehydropantoate 2-reductase [Rhodospirillales bacterium]
MKVCIFGAGAIGGFMGAEMAHAGADVTLIARGPHLAAIQDQGLGLERDGEVRRIQVQAFEDPAQAGPQDYVVITLKAHSVPGVVDAMQPLLGPDTTVVSGVNGVPWWYFYGLEGEYEDRRLESVDPGDGQWQKFGPERMLGCVVYPAAEVI